MRKNEKLQAAVGKRVHHLAEYQRLTNYMISKDCGLSQTTIGNIRSGKSMPSIETLKVLCETLDVSLCDFFIFDDNGDKDLNLTERDKRLLKAYHKLSENKQEWLLIGAEKMLADADAE